MGSIDSHFERVMASNQTLMMEMVKSMEQAREAADAAKLEKQETKLKATQDLALQKAKLKQKFAHTRYKKAKKMFENRLRDAKDVQQDYVKVDNLKAINNRQ